MDRTFGRLTTTLVLGVAAAIAATTSGIALDQPAVPEALNSGHTQSAEASSERRAIADWSLIAQKAIVAVGKKFPGEAAVYMGIVHATIYDVVAAIEGGYRPYAITPTVPPDTSLEAAVATAAHRVLAGRVWAGFHFRYSQEDGSRLGRKVGRFVARNFFQPLD